YRAQAKVGWEELGGGRWRGSARPRLPRLQPLPHRSSPSPVFSKSSASRRPPARHAAHATNKSGRLFGRDQLASPRSRFSRGARPPARGLRLRAMRQQFCEKEASMLKKGLLACALALGLAVPARAEVTRLPDEVVRCGTP